MTTRQVRRQRERLAAKGRTDAFTPIPPSPPRHRPYTSAQLMERAVQRMIETRGGLRL